MGYDSYIRGWRERWARDEAEAASRAARARDVTRRLARVLYEEHGARRVWLVGSLAWGQFGLASDIDLAVEGLEPGTLFRAGADLERLAGEFAVDLVPVESASPAYLEKLHAEGVVLDDQRSH